APGGLGFRDRADVRPGADLFRTERLYARHPLRRRIRLHGFVLAGSDRLPAPAELGEVYGDLQLQSAGGGDFRAAKHSPRGRLTARIAAVAADDRLVGGAAVWFRGLPAAQARIL